MVRIGDAFFVSSVEVTQPTDASLRRSTATIATPAQGVGHLFKIDASGKLLADLKLGEGTIFHPGGIDYDGTDIWVPVAEYRPNSRSIVYRVNPQTMKATEVSSVGRSHRRRRARHRRSHAARRELGLAPLLSLEAGRQRPGVESRGLAGNRRGRLNPSHYVDYQDCKYVGQRRMLCTGVTELRASAGATPFRLGGLDLIDLRDGRPLHQVPMLIWTAGGLDMTHNPAWFEATATGLRGYFMPEDDKSTIYVYDAELPEQ